MFDSEKDARNDGGERAGIESSANYNAHYEEARRERVEAEMRQQRQERRFRREEAINQAVGNAAKTKKGRQTLLIIGICIIMLAIIISGFIVPSLISNPKTKYHSTASLEKIVKTSKFSTIDCVYKGIAEKDGASWLFIPTDSGYRIKYAAHVSAGFDFSKIRLEQGDNDKTIVVYYPEPTINNPSIEEDSLSFIPENYPGDLGEIIRLCKEDAIQEVAGDGRIKEVAVENLKNTVYALTKPFVSDEFTFEFRQIS